MWKQTLIFESEAILLKSWHSKLVYLLIGHAPEHVRPGMKKLYDYLAQLIDRPEKEIPGGYYAAAIWQEDIEVVYATDEFGEAHFAELIGTLAD